MGRRLCVESEYYQADSGSVINAGAPATLRFLRKHRLAVAGFVSTVAFDLDVAEVACTADVLRLRPELQTSYTNRYFYACEYLEMQVMSRFVKGHPDAV